MSRWMQGSATTHSHHQHSAPPGGHRHSDSVKRTASATRSLLTRISTERTPPTPNCAQLNMVLVPSQRTQDARAPRQRAPHDPRSSCPRHEAHHARAASTELNMLVPTAPSPPTCSCPRHQAHQYPRAHGTEPTNTWLVRTTPSPPTCSCPRYQAHQHMTRAHGTGRSNMLVPTAPSPATPCAPHRAHHHMTRVHHTEPIATRAHDTRTRDIRTRSIYSRNLSRASYSHTYIISLLSRQSHLTSRYQHPANSRH